MAKKYRPGNDRDEVGMGYAGGTSNVHPGFKAVQGRIMKEGYTPEQAGAILASKTRKASAGAKRKNPRLRRVKG